MSTPQTPMQRSLHSDAIGKHTASPAPATSQVCSLSFLTFHVMTYRPYQPILSPPMLLELFEEETGVAGMLCSTVPLPIPLSFRTRVSSATGSAANCTMQNAPEHEHLHNGEDIPQCSSNKCHGNA